MAGSLREKSPGVWELRVYLGRDAAGKVRHKYARFQGGKRQAQRELARLVAELDAGEGDIVLDWGPETTVNDAVVGWQRNGWDDLEATVSAEADVAFWDDPDEAKSDRVDGAIGEYSPFHQQFGYYGQGASVATAVLPAGWRDRVVRFDRADAEPSMAVCIEAHDLVVSKLVAGREKDISFAGALIRERLVEVSTRPAGPPPADATPCPVRGVSGPYEPPRRWRTPRRLQVRLSIHRADRLDKAPRSPVGRRRHDEGVRRHPVRRTSVVAYYGWCMRRCRLRRPQPVRVRRRRGRRHDEQGVLGRQPRPRLLTCPSLGPSVYTRGGRKGPLGWGDIEPSGPPGLPDPAERYWSSQ